MMEVLRTVAAALFFFALGALLRTVHAGAVLEDLYDRARGRLARRRVIPSGVLLRAAIATGVLVTAAVALTLGLRAIAAAEERAAAAEVKASVLRMEAIGWAAAAARGTKRQGQLLEQLAAGDSMRRAAAQEVERLRGQVVALTQLDIAADGTVTAAADVVADSATTEVEDGPLRARLAYFPADSLFRLEWSARIRAELVHARAGNHLLVFARSTDPRVELSATLEYELPPPSPRAPRLRCAGVAAGSGALAAIEARWWTIASGLVVTSLACR